VEIDSIVRADIAHATIPREPFPSNMDRPIGRMILPDSYEEVRLFALLLWKFKRPNGPLTVLGPPDGDPDGPFKWDYIFEIEGIHVQVIRTANGLEILWWGRDVAKKSIESFISFNMALQGL